jgi:hypothetical protein
VLKGVLRTWLEAFKTYCEQHTVIMSRVNRLYMVLVVHMFRSVIIIHDASTIS